MSTFSHYEKNLLKGFQDKRTHHMHLQVEQFFFLVCDTVHQKQATVADCRAGKTVLNTPKVGNISKTAYKKWQ